MADVDYKWEYAHRQENNLSILEELKAYIERYPDMRFIQVLWALGIIDRDKDFRIIDRFYEEPGVTLQKVRETRKAQELCQ